MADLGHLEKMGRELKCPICLSLLKSAASLACNHVFCNLCILESMKSLSNCPVCKVPFHRREVRAAPHMDNLVSVYKSMEFASGVNIFTTQVAPSAKTSDGTCQVDDDRNLGSPKTKMTCRGKSKGKGLRCKQRQNFEKANVKSISKKRVHVTPYPASETPIRPEKVLKTRNLSIEPGVNKLSDQNEKVVTDEQGGPLFSPFFWLREETGDDEAHEKLSAQQTQDALTPQNPPCFSDIKDSDDDAPLTKMTPTSKPNVAEAFDSEMFEWTQRACSPELCSTPLKKQLAGRHDLILQKSGLANSQREVAPFSVLSEIGRNSENIQSNCKAEPGRTSNARKASDNKKKKASVKVHRKYDNDGSSEHIQSNAKAEPSRTGDARGEIDNKKKKANVKAQRKHAKEPICRNSGSSIVEVLEVANDSREKTKNSNQESDDAEKHRLETEGNKRCNKTSRHYPRKHVKVPMSQFEDTDIGLERLPTIFDTSRSQTEQFEGAGIVLPVLPSLEKTNDNVRDDHCKTGKRCKRATIHFQSKRMKTLDDSIAKKLEKVPVNSEAKIQNQEYHKATKNLQVSSDKQCENECSCNRRSRNKEIRKEQLAESKEKNKNVQADDFPIVKDADKVPLALTETAKCEKNQIAMNCQSSDSMNAKNSLKTKEFHSSNGDNVLKKCENMLSRIHCAFCQSSDDTEVSGEMMHYFNGKPVGADYNEGVNVIHSHKNCTEWAPDVYFEDDLANNLAAELARSRRIKCSCCGIKGAALGCYVKSCRKSFHFTCAKLTPECRWDNKSFVMLCPLHSSLKLPNESSKPHKQHRKRPTPNVEAQATFTYILDSDATQKWSWPSGSPCKWLLCCSALTVSEKELISEFTRLTGISISKTWIPAVTHVIASTDENGACRRTLKFLMGILDGKWILSIDWIRACMEAMKPVEEEKYEITRDVHGISGGPQLGRLRIADKQPKLFSGFRFYFTGDFQPSYKGYLQDLVITAGGVVLQRKPISRDQEKLLDDSPMSETFIIYSIEFPEKHKLSLDAKILSRRCSEAQALADACGAKVADNSWILDSIAACKLQTLA